MVHHKLKASQELVLGDKIKVGGLLCEVLKIEDIFHYVPNTRVRVFLSIEGTTKNKETIIVLFPTNTAIETLK